MDLFNGISNPPEPTAATTSSAIDTTGTRIKCIDMHTAGEPTRIIISGYPDLDAAYVSDGDGPGPSRPTLLEQRSIAQQHYDNVRRLLVLEPRGHYNMYGAVLRPSTELVRSGDAHIGVLFLTNDGYSTMCGHATIALGRFLFDTLDLHVFPRRQDVEVFEDEDDGTDTRDTLGQETAGEERLKNARIILHAPCGPVSVTVPVKRKVDGDDGSGLKSDPSRPVSFLSVPSFVCGTSVSIDVPVHSTWPELAQSGRTSVRVDFSYGGAFYCLVAAEELGFLGGLRDFDFDAMRKAARNLKAAVVANSTNATYFRHPVHQDLSFLYSVMVVDKSWGAPARGTVGAETGLCFFADEQVDRSPTGSAVAARIALAHLKGEIDTGQSWIYHSLMSSRSRNAKDAEKNAFVGKAMGIAKDHGLGELCQPVDVQVQGYAFYTGCQSYFVEDEDPLKTDGFVFEKLGLP